MSMRGRRPRVSAPRSPFDAAPSWHMRSGQYQHHHHRQQLQKGARGYAVASSRDHAIQTFDIPCGSAGTVTVDISNPDLLTTPSTPLIIYLPPTSVQLGHSHPARVPSLVSSFSFPSNTLSKWPVARINYRWNIPQGASLGTSNPPQSASHLFPTPLHDTLHAYTWLTTTFLPSFAPNLGTNSLPRRSPSPYASASQPDKRSSLRPLLIYGSFLGGTLASSLSLTETRTRPVGFSIQGTIIRNGVFDWTHIATSRAPLPTNDPPLMTSESDLWDINTLHTLKTHLFPSPASAFDPFASPVLFFRSPGLSVPSYFPGTSPPSRPSLGHDPALLDGLSISEEELASLRASASSSPSSQPQHDGDEEITVERKSALRFPPKDSGLKIPRSLLLTTSALQVGARATPKKRGRAKAGQQQKPGEEMRRQAEEMTKVMRRSLVTHEFKDRASWDGDEDPHVLSEERVQIQELQVEESEKEEAEVVEEFIAGLGLELE